MSEKSEELYDKALDLIQEGKVQEGIAAIEESLMEDAEDGMTWRLYGVALTAVGRGDDAAGAMEKGEKFGLPDVEGFLMRAAEAQVAGNMDAAISRYEDALELDEKRFEIWAGYSVALLQAGYKDDALEASEKAVALGAEHPQSWYARGRVLRLTGDMAAALPAYDKAVELDPKGPVAWHERGMVQVELGDATAAVESFERVLELQPGDAAAEQGLAIARERLKG
jgi:tetratricopeptide (TPR) repeat protein